jgi:hypothetical protein
LYNATTAAVLAVLAQSSCYHWRDEDGRDAYAIVRLDRKSDADDLCPAMYDAYYLHGADAEGEPCTTWACTDLWLEQYAEHRTDPWALPLHLWAMACADADQTGVRAQHPGDLALRRALTRAADTVQDLNSAPPQRPQAQSPSM